VTLKGPELVEGYIVPPGYKATVTREKGVTFIGMTRIRSPMKLNPLRDQVLIRRAEAESETASGLIIPDDAKRKSQQGEVLAVGPGRILDNGQECPMRVKVGDVVLIGRYDGVEVDLDGEPYVLVPEGSVLGIVEEP